MTISWPRLPVHPECNPGVKHPQQMICPEQIKMLVAAERERCAKAAESFREYGEEMTHRGALCQNIAENIRAGS